jgi:DNA-directed RNA polymerase specialized sigma24 family protein
LGCALALLRRCAATTYIDLVRQAARHATMAEVELEDDTLRDARDDRADAMLRDLELQAEIWRRLNGEEERVVFQYSYEHECKPGEIAQIRPDLFTDAHAVSTIKERIKKRLSQDHVLHGLLRG